MRRSHLHTGIVVAALTLAAGLEPALGTAAERMAIYSWADYFGQTTLADFQAANGVEVQYDTFPAPEVLETKLLTGTSGYDLVFPSASLAARIDKAAVLAPIDAAKLWNYGNLDPAILEMLRRYENGAQLGVPYSWGTVGIGYNEELIRARMPDAPVDSLDMLFKPELAAKFADCGIAVIDSPVEITSIALNYLGLDPHSGRAEDLVRAQALLEGLRPHVRYFDSTRPIQDLASGEICLALTYSGDVGTAQLRAAEAGAEVKLGYVIPVQGTVLWMDLMAIPKDAPHPELAYALIDYLLQPQVIAGMTNYLTYANANAKATPYVDESIRANAGIYPPEEVKRRLFPDTPLEEGNVRARNRAWTRMKSGL